MEQLENVIMGLAANYGIIIHQMEGMLFLQDQIIMDMVFMMKIWIL